MERKRGLVLASTYNNLLDHYWMLMREKDSTIEDYEEKNEQYKKVCDKLQMYYDMGNLFDYLVYDGHDIHFEELMFNVCEQIDLDMYKNLKDISFLMEFNREKELRRL
jgi:hypothetical protein